ncbi:MAG: hypothetical protein K6B42_01330 [Clostridia bacterium]|nr:hypothetical protein [Clostridia bacterium]
MRIDEVIKQCIQSDEDILWALQDDHEAVAHRKSLMFFSEPGLISDIREALDAKSSSDDAGKVSLPQLTESKKLSRYFDLVGKTASTQAKKEAFVSQRKLLDSGTDAICLETMDGQQKWIDKDLAEAFAFKRKYLFVDPSAVNADDIAADEIANMVFIEEEGKIAGIVMSLRI